MPGAHPCGALTGAGVRTEAGGYAPEQPRAQAAARTGTGAGTGAGARSISTDLRACTVSLRGEVACPCGGRTRAGVRPRAGMRAWAGARSIRTDLRPRTALRSRRRGRVRAGPARRWHPLPMSRAAARERRASIQGSAPRPGRTCRPGRSVKLGGVSGPGRRVGPDPPLDRSRHRRRSGCPGRGSKPRAGPESRRLTHPYGDPHSGRTPHHAAARIKAPAHVPVSARHRPALNPPRPRRPRLPAGTRLSSAEDSA